MPPTTFSLTVNRLDRSVRFYGDVLVFESGSAHVYFLVHEIEEALAGSPLAGYTSDRRPYRARLAPTVARAVYFSDPDGMMLELMQPPPRESARRE